MKRLTYISRAAANLTTQELDKIAEISIAKNQAAGITGVLLYLNGIFFQILEGESEIIDQLYVKIIKDQRHDSVLCLKTEQNIQQRLFPDWAMKTVNLEQQTEILLQPVKSLLQTIVESHGILEQYTQPAVMRIIRSGINPLTVLPHTIEKIIFFSDIVAFSTFAEKLPVQQVVDLVNQYLEICAQIISNAQGEVIKFIGDCVMASFTIEQADMAITASLNILQHLRHLRQQLNHNEPLSLLHTGIGLSCGNVIEGNMGSQVKMDYTLLGDAVNIAARLETLTRQLPYSLILCS